MNGSEFKELLVSTHERLLSLTDSKGIEYAHDADQLANFKRLGSQLQLHPTAILLVYLQKHLDAITAFVAATTKGQRPIESEPIEGRIDDAILYLILLKALIHDTPSIRDPG